MNKKEKLLILFFLLLFPIINCDSITMEDDSAQEIEHESISLATNSGYNLDGGDPNACVDSSTVTKSTKDLVVGYYGSPVKEGTVSLKYSPTCNTFWAKIELRAPVSEDGYAQGEVVRFGNNKKTLKCNVKPGKTWCYTPQLYNDGSSFTGQIFLEVWGGKSNGALEIRGDQTSAVQVAIKGGYSTNQYTINGKSTGYPGYIINGDTWVHWNALGILGIKNLYHTNNSSFFEFPNEGGRTAPAKSINGQTYLVWADLSRNNDGNTRIKAVKVNGVWNFTLMSENISDNNNEDAEVCPITKDSTWEDLIKVFGEVAWEVIDHVLKVPVYLNAPIPEWLLRSIMNNGCQLDPELTKA